MIHRALQRPIPVELTSDARIERRVKRLAAVSTVALGAIWVMARTTLDAPMLVEGMLAAGWLLMPLTLVASLQRLALRYWLVVPSTLVSAALVIIVVAFLPEDPAAVVGWLSMTAGVLLGGLMGAWFWFRLIPVPPALDDPSSSARWALIGLHVSLITAGLLLVVLVQLASLS